MQCSKLRRRGRWRTIKRTIRPDEVCVLSSWHEKFNGTLETASDRRRAKSCWSKQGSAPQRLDGGVENVRPGLAPIIRCVPERYASHHELDRPFLDDFPADSLLSVNSPVTDFARACFPLLVPVWIISSICESSARHPSTLYASRGSCTIVGPAPPAGCIQ